MSSFTLAPRLAIAIGVISVAVTFASHVGAEVSSVQGPAEGLWNGVYTEEQANRGKGQYMETCSSCHAEDLRGDGQAPPIAGVEFMFSWDGRSLDDLFTRIRGTMPQDRPGSLSGDAYIDIVAFLLQSNNFPVGTQELGRDADRLKSLKIASKSP